MTVRSTIFALSSGHPPAAIAVIRISGPRTAVALEALGIKLPAPRQAKLARIKHPATGEIIDEAVALWFPGPNSETGEDVAELQAHGGRAVIAAILGALGSIDGLRMAEPGEFTRRGFENGKMDLTAVEGLADLVGAETESQRRQAFRQMKGLLGDRAEAWRAKLIHALALVEARIDFSDEADVPEDLVGPALVIVRELRDEIAAALADGGRGERLREGLVVAIAGPPNAGKSTLLNRLARREVAIVSPYAGTTRDVIEVHLDLGGFPVTLLDTAGIRATDDPVEQEGVRRARDRAAAADLVLWVTDATGPMEFDRAGLGSAPVWRVRNKSDLLRNTDRVEPAQSGVEPAQKGSVRSGLGPITPSSNETDESSPTSMGAIDSHLESDVYKNEPPDHLLAETGFTISAATAAELGALLAALARFAELAMTGSEQSLVTRARHRQILVAVQHKLDQVISIESSVPEELLAEQLRLAAMELGRLAGRVDVEDVLDVIFGEFCIGK